MTHTLTKSDGCTEDGTGRGTPIVAVSDLGQGQRIRSIDEPSETLRATKRGPFSDYYVQPLAIRGREGGAELEAGEPGAPANALRSAGGGGGGSLYPLVAISSDDTPVSFAENQRGEIREGDTVGALSLGGGKPGQGYQAVRHETIVRRLTEMECERLQGFPDGWTDGQTASARYRQLGNSVAVPCVEWIARRLIATDQTLNEGEVTA